MVREDTGKVGEVVFTAASGDNDGLNLGDGVRAARRNSTGLMVAVPASWHSFPSGDTTARLGA